MKIDSGIRSAALWATVTLGSGLADQVESDRFHAGDPGPGAYFGTAIAASGTTAVVAAAGDDHDGLTDAGAVYIFERSGSSWAETAKLTASDGESHDGFGSSISIFDDTLVVGAARDAHSGLTAPGSVYIFERSGSGWIEQVKLTASDAADHCWFGISVALIGDTLVVGAPSEDSLGTNAGAAYVFVRAGSMWSEQAKLAGSDTTTYHKFGASLALLSEEELVIGAVGAHQGIHPLAGAAYVFQRSGVSWTQTARLAARDPTPGGNFGSALAASADTIVASVYRDHPSSGLTLAGAAYVFVRSGPGWSFQAKLTASDASDDDRFGWGLSLFGDHLVLGAPGNEQFAATDGCAYVFARTGTNWTEEFRLLGLADSLHDELGTSVCLAGEQVLGGAPRNKVGTSSDAGAVFVYDRDPPGTMYCFGVGCPCGNDGGASGCVNSTGYGGLLVPRNSSSVAANDLRLRATDLPIHRNALLFAGTHHVAAGAGSPLGDGLRCARGAVIRLGGKNTGYWGQAVWDQDLVAACGVAPGDQRFFQVYYRDAPTGPCGTRINLTNGIAVTFTP